MILDATARPALGQAPLAPITLKVCRAVPCWRILPGNGASPCCCLGARPLGGTRQARPKASHTILPDATHYHVTVRTTQLAVIRG